MTDRTAVRRSALQGLAAGALGLAALPRSGRAQAWPSNPIRMLVGAPPGGPSDFLGRLFGESVGPLVGQGIVVENRPGAGGALAAEAAARAPADGHTLHASGPSAMLVAPLLVARLGYDPAADFAPIAMAGAGGFVLAVHPSVPAATVAELVALARARPGALGYGSGGNGSSGHLTTELFARATRTRLTHVPYKGDGQAVVDLLGGQIQLMFTAPNVAMPHVKAGRLRALGVTTRERIATLGDLPSLHEAGVTDFESLGWIGVFAPSATPRPVLVSLADAWSRARRQPAVQARLEELGMAAPERFGTSAAFAGFLDDERKRLAVLVRDLGLKPE